MRIAMVVHDYHRQGGHSRYVTELAERYSREHEVHIFANRFPAGSLLYPKAALENRQLYFRPVYAHRATALGTVLSFFWPATRAIAAAGPFDLVHGQGFVCAQAEVLTAHICCAAWHEKRLASGYRLNAKEQLFDAVATGLERWVYRRSPHLPLIAISRRVQLDLDRFYGRHDNVFVVPHGVDASEFDYSQRERWRQETRASLKLPPDRFAALWVGDLRKGVPAAIQAVAQVPEATLVAVSRNEPAPFLEMARHAGIANRVIFVPPTTQIARYYAAADAFLFPTTYDAFGMVVLEAMAMGLPPIVSRDAGAAELINDGVDGLLLDDPFDPAPAAACLRRLIDDPSSRSALASAALMTARGADWDRVARETFALYEKAISVK